MSPCIRHKPGLDMKQSSTVRTPRERASHYEVAKRLGLVGCIAGPKDLARNHRKYVRQAVRAKRSA